MDREEIQLLLGKTIYTRAEDICRAGEVHDLVRRKNESGIWQLSASVEGTREYEVRVWLRENGSFVSGSCTCPYNEDGHGPHCKHIGAVLLMDLVRQEHPAVQEVADLPGVMRGSELAARSAAAQRTEGDYTANLNMLFGKKWRGEEPDTDWQGRTLLRQYQKEEELLTSPAEAAPAESVSLEPELFLDPEEGSPVPRLRVRIRSGGRAYIVKSIPELLAAVESGRKISYGRQLELSHREESFDPPSRWLLALLRRQQAVQSYLETQGAPRTARGTTARAGTIPLYGELFDELIDHYLPEGGVGETALYDGMPGLTLKVKKEKGGAKISLPAGMGTLQGAQWGYLFSSSELWRIRRSEAARIRTGVCLLSGQGAFFAQRDLAAFCSYVLPQLGDRVRMDDPDRLLLDRIALRPVVQFYLDAPGLQSVTAHAEFLYGEQRVADGAPTPAGLLRDERSENRARQLLARWLVPEGEHAPGRYWVFEEEEIERFLDEGVPALIGAGEVYLSDDFRKLEAAPPKISVGVSVSGSVLDLEIDTGEFPAEELRELIKSLRSKKRYHRLRDGRLLRLDSGMQVLDELNEAVELSGARLGEGRHLTMPLYRAPGLDRVLSEAEGIHFRRDDAFRRISRSFRTAQDSEYTPPASLGTVLRRYQREGYRWLRTLDGYGMGGILADDMGLGKTLQVLAFLLAKKEQGETLPSLIVCPASLVLNWEEECRRFTPQLRCLVIDGPAARRQELLDTAGEYDLVAVSYDLLRRDAEAYAARPFYACVLDEAQAIKNHTTQKYKAVCRVNSRVRFALTGTPVENRLSELWSIFSFLMPGYLYPYKTFADRFERPITLEHSESAARRLSQITAPFLLRRMKAEVLKELPPKIEDVLPVQLEESQRRLYLAAVLDAKERLRAAKPEDRMAVFAVLMRLRQICCDPALVTDEWAGGSAKLDACMELISEAVEGGHRVILFSQFTSMLELVGRRLTEAGLTHFTLQGSTPKPVRAELVRRFNGGEADVFLISLRAGGTGLNLTAADIVIHYDPWWNLAAQNQATDRAYRIGQRNTVQVYKLIARDTIEEKILELQQTKQELANTIVGAAEGSVPSLKPEELLALLEES